MVAWQEILSNSFNLFNFNYIRSLHKHHYYREIQSTTNLSPIRTCRHSSRRARYCQDNGNTSTPSSSSWIANISDRKKKVASCVTPHEQINRNKDHRQTLQCVFVREDTNPPDQLSETIFGRQPFFFLVDRRSSSPQPPHIKRYVNVCLLIGQHFACLTLLCKRFERRRLRC